MKNIILISIFVFGFFATAFNVSANNPPIEFRGYAEFNGEQVFSLKSTQKGGSAWVCLGQSFCEGKLIGYDRVSKSVTFSSSEGTFKVKMFKAEESESLNYITSNQTDSANVTHHVIIRSGSTPRVLTTCTYRETDVHENKPVDSINLSKPLATSSSERISVVNVLNNNRSGGLDSSYETSDQFGLDNENRSAVTRRGSIPRVQTSRTREEKEVSKEAFNNRNYIF